MEPAELARAVRRAVQVTIAGKISYFLTLHVPHLASRAVLTVGASVLLVALRGSDPSASTAADISLAVASSTLIEGLSAPGPGSLPLTLGHLCAAIESSGVVAPLMLGHLGDSFLGNVQYLFANAIAGVLLAAALPVLALVGAAGLAALSSWGCPDEALLSVALAQASTSVIKTMVLQSIPIGLQLPSIVGLLCFFRPLYRLLGLGEPVYTFALYQAGDALQSSLEGVLPAFTSTLVALAMYSVAPIPAFRATAQIAAVGSATDLVIDGLREVADADPFPSLLSILVFSRVILVAFPG